jgi:hypothetical protein
MLKMKIRLLIAFAVLAFGSTNAQTGAPQRINYQGISRDGLGNIITGGSVGIEFRINQGSPGGTQVFLESQVVNPNAAGIFTAAIGAVSSLASINWANGPYYLTIGIDPSGGSSYTTVGTHQLLSVPYALYAENAKAPAVSISGSTLSVGGNTVALPGATGYTAGTGIAIGSGTVTNTAMDQTVAITAGNNVNVMSAYPNFTVDVPNSSLNFNNATSVLSLTQGSNVSTVTLTASSSTSVSIVGPNVTGSYPNYTINASPATTLTAGNSNISITGASPSYTISSTPTLSIVNDTLTISNGNSVVLPATALTAGSGIAVGSGTITNIAPDQTVTLSNGTNVAVSGTYPSFTVDATPSLSISSSSLSISGGNTVLLPTSTTYTNGVGISLGTGTTITNTAPDQTVTLTGSGSATVTGTYPNFNINTPIPSPPTAGTGISISGGTIANTAPNQTVNISGAGVSGTYPNYTITSGLTTTVTSGNSNITVAGTAPNFTVSSTPSLNLAGNVLSISNGNSVTLLPPPATTITGAGIVTVSPTSGNNFTVNVAAPNLTGAGATTVSGTYPNLTINSPVAVTPTITGTGMTSVTSSGSSYTVTSPPITLSYIPSSGVLTYNPAPGNATLNITPSVSFTNNVLTVGSNSTTIPGTGLWSASGTTAVVTTNSLNFVGMGTSNPTHKLQIESTANTELSLVAPAASKAGILFGTPTTHALGKIDYSNSTNIMSLWTNGVSDRIAIDNAGRVGIGTSAPTENLQIHTGGTASLSLISTTGTAGILTFGHTGNHFMGAVRYDHSNNNMNFWTNNTADRMIIDGTGRVGIGGHNMSTTPANAAMHIAKAGANDGRLVLTGGDNSNTYGAMISMGENLNPGGQGFAIKMDAGVNRLNFINDFDGATAPVMSIGGYSGTNIGVMIGQSYTGSNAPVNGLAVQGRVGIGNSVPGYNLDVMGSNPSINIEETGTSNANLIFSRAGTQRWYLLENFLAPQDNLAIYDASTGIKKIMFEQGAIGNVTIDAYTRLGSSAPAIKMHKLTSTTAAAQNASTTIPIPASIPIAQILSISVMVQWSGVGEWIQAGYTINSGYEFNWYVSGQNIVVTNKNATSFNILSRPIQVLITYEQ